jgi:hypothetical protein
MKHEELTKDLNFKEATLSWKPVVRGRPQEDHGLLGKNSGGGQSVTYKLLTLWPDTGSVDLVFALHRSRVVTFQVRPEFYPPRE